MTKLRPGELAGFGCMVDACRTCESCRRGLEQFCEGGAAMTYNGTEMDRKMPTYGGYSARVVVDERFALRIGIKEATVTASEVPLSRSDLRTLARHATQ